MGDELKLVEFTKEGLIVNALMGGSLRYKDLKRVTGLSDAWLSRKLQELLQIGIVILWSGRYRLDVGRLQEALRDEKPFVARLMAQEIVRKDSGVVGVVLFGSLVRDSRRDGDIDLLVVTGDGEFNPVGVSLEMFRRFGLAVDIVSVSLKDLFRWLYELPPIVFGILSGYEVLFDGGCIRDFLKILKGEALKRWTYVEEEKLWLRSELLPRMLKRP